MKVDSDMESYPGLKIRPDGPEETDEISEDAVKTHVALFLRKSFQVIQSAIAMSAADSDADRLRVLLQRKLVIARWLDKLRNG